jgi:hypothetical protein
MSLSTSDALVAVQHRRPRRRLLAVSTWLGAGAVTIGVGAALAGASGVAQADTVDHHVAGSTSTGKTEASSSAGPKATKRAHVSDTAQAASPKRTLATARPTTLRAAAAKTSASPVAKAAAVAAASSSTTTQTISTPFGPIKITSTSTAPAPGTSGPVGLSLLATTPVGNAKFSLTGSSTFVAGLPSVTTVKFTDGTFVVPGAISFLLDAAGPVVTGGTSLVNSGKAFMSAVNSGNPIGAAVALFSAGLNFENAILFGHTTITVPLGSVGSSSGSTINVHIPFGGLFSSLQPLTVTVPGYTYTDPSGLFVSAVDASHISFDGTRLGGIFPGFLKSIGIG